MRITTFSNNRIFGQNKSAQSGKAKQNNIVADMAQTLRENAQSSLKTAAQQQAAVSRVDKVEISVKEAVKSPAERAVEIFKALTGTDSKLANEKLMDLQAAKAMQESLQEQADSARDQAEAMAESMKYMLKMLEIARRISSGGQVPGSDEQKLLEYSQELYTMAKMMALQAKDHEKYDSLFEDEEEQAGGAEGAADAMSGVEPAAVVEGGGDAAAAAEVSVEVSVE